MYEKINECPRILFDLRDGRYTQTELAELIGVSRQKVGEWENCKDFKLPRIDHLIKLAQLYDVDIDYLLGEIDTPKHETADVCELTGLSEVAVDYLSEFKREYTEICDVYSRLIEYEMENFPDGIANTLLEYIINSRAYDREFNTEELKDYSIASQLMAKTSFDIAKRSVSYDRWKVSRVFEDAIDSIASKIGSHNLSKRVSKEVAGIKESMRQTAEQITKEREESRRKWQMRKREE